MKSAWGYIKGLSALALILVIWTAFLLSNPVGWHWLAITAIAVFMPSLRDYAINRWEKDDEIINRLLGGMKRHTISGRAGYGAISTEAPRYTVSQAIIDTLFGFQPYHCFVSVNWRLFGPEQEKEYKARHKTLHGY